MCMCFVKMQAQISGFVYDKTTGEALPFVNVRYDKSTVGTITNSDGHYKIKRINGGTLVVSCVGYEQQNIIIKPKTSDYLNIKLSSVSVSLKSATVKGQKKKYTKKDNPAVALMRKVIAAKRDNDPHINDYFSYNHYNKLTLAFNEYTDKTLQNIPVLSKMHFLKDYVETCEVTGKKILPISYSETYSQHIYRKNPKDEKDIVFGERHEGMNDFLTTGDILTNILDDCFSDIDLYKEIIRFLKHAFVSPISTHYAINFYRYFIEDTVKINGVSCINVGFTPNNVQDFGFSGNLYIVNDTTYRLKKALIRVPKNTGVNFVDQLDIDQEYVTLSSGQQALSKDVLTMQMSLLEDFGKVQVQRSEYFSNYSLEPVSDVFFDYGGNRRVLETAKTRDSLYWANIRPTQLTQGEAKMGNMLNQIEDMKNFNVVLVIVRALIENFVETSTKKPNLVDIGPINTLISNNFVDGWRLRLSAQTTANLNSHLFVKGYIARGFKNHRWEGLGEVIYSFNKKEYSWNEFPVNNLSISAQSDVMSPSDVFMVTDKDNVFTSLKVHKVDQMQYFKRLRLSYEKEWYNGIKFSLSGKYMQNKGAGALFYQSLDGTGSPSNDITNHIEHFNTADVQVGIYCHPNTKYTQTKQKRVTINKTTPYFSLYHTFGVKAFGGDYTYNFTEATYYRHLWVPTAGYLEMTLKAGAQWNKVPYPLLIMPAANLSYIAQKETFSMINNMEFLNDRYASLMLTWNLDGKIFNRIPLLKKLKWREFVGVNMLWGMLTSKNNPYKNPEDEELFYFPGHWNNSGTFEYSSFLMDKKPYYEVFVGVRNILKFFTVQGVRRMNYLNMPHAQKWGIRIMFNPGF